MIILHSADWHLDSPFASFSEEQRRFLRRHMLSIPDRIADLCIREHCDLVLLAGDLFDGTASRESIDALKRGLARCTVPVFIAPGNHDYICSGSPWLEEVWPDNVHIFTGGLESFCMDSLDCRIWGSAFRSMDCPPLLKDFRADCRERYTLALFHGDPVNTASPYNPITAAQVKASSVDYLALGHIHKAGSFRSGNTLCGWPGCPMGRGWDETGEKGVYLVDVDENAARIREVSLSLPCFREVTVDISGGAEEALQAVLPPVRTEDLYTVVLTGTGNADIPTLLQSFPHIPNLKLSDRTEAPLDIWGSESRDTLEGTYFRMLKEQLAGADPETARRITLAAEISRRLIEGREVILP